MQTISGVELSLNEEEDEVFRNVEKLKSQDIDFARLVMQVESKLNFLIDFTNNKKRFHPKNSLPKVRIVVDAVKMTTEEFKVLNELLNKKYLEKVSGDHFCIKKMLFSNKYKIYTKKRIYYDDYDECYYICG